MGPIFEGDGWFCVIAIIVSELLADIPWLSAQMRLPGIVMISLIFALFYGPEPKRISKKVFAGGVVGLMAASLLGELVGNFICCRHRPQGKEITHLAYILLKPKYTSCGSRR